jgi:hypothetical protein
MTAGPAISFSAVQNDSSRRRVVANRWIRSARSPIHGRGVYARTDIPSGTRIVEYVGDRISKAEARKREQLRLERQRRGGDGCVYIFELNRRYDLDGDVAGNVARFINHSCAPNCRAETIRGRIWILAKRDIPAGTELSFDYGYAFSEWRLHPCRCGARRCPGFIVNEYHRWRVRRILRAERRLKPAPVSAQRSKAKRSVGK